MNLIDLIIIALLGYGLIKGYKKGLIIELSSFFGVFISLNLALVNLLPIPALDGGHIVLYIFEIILGKPLPIYLQNILVSISKTIHVILFSSTIILLAIIKEFILH